MSLYDPRNRKEIYYRGILDGDNSLPEPQTREEIFLKAIAEAMPIITEATVEQTTGSSDVNVMSQKATTEALETVASTSSIQSYFKYNRGYIDASGNAIIPDVLDYNQHFTQILNKELFSTVRIEPKDGYRIAVAKYSNGVFISRDGWTTSTLEYDNQYDLLLCICTLTSTPATDDPDTLNQYYQIYANNILAGHQLVLKERNIFTSFAIGNIPNGTSDQNRVSITHAVTLTANMELYTRQGYQMAIYGTGGLIFTWTNSIQIITDSSNYWLVFRKTDGTNFDITTVKIEDMLVVSDYSIFGDDKYIMTDCYIDEEDIISGLRDKSAVFVGDSITYGTGTTDGNIYWQILSEKCHLKNVVGAGVAGSCMSITSNYGSANSPIASRWNSIPQKDIICIFAGTNDYGHDTPMGTISDATDISFYGALNVIIQGLVNKFPSSRLIFITPLHRYNFGGLTYDTVANGEGNTLKDYVDAIKTACELYSIPVIDAFSISGMNPSISGIYSTYITDGLHPNSAGHHLLADRIYPVFKDYGRT